MRPDFLTDFNFLIELLSYKFINDIGYDPNTWNQLNNANAMPSYTQFAVLTQIRHPESVDKVPAPFDTANIAGKKFNVKLRLTDALFGTQVAIGIEIGMRDDIEKDNPVLRPDPAMTKRLIMQYGAVEVSYFVPGEPSFD